MNTTESIIADMLGVIESSIDDFTSKMPAIEKDLFSRLQTVLKEIETAGGKLKPSVANYKKLNSLRGEIEEIIFTDKYKKAAAKFTDSFSAISDLQDNYFSSLNVDYTPKKVGDALRLQSIEETTASLTESGISFDVSEGVRDILKSNITGKASYSDMVEQMREYLSASDGGALSRYAKTYTTDALNQYSAQYNQLITADLGLEWHQYVGSLRKKSREFCIKLTEKRYIHDSELETILESKINGKKLAVNPKTGLWYGANKDTTKSNFATMRGGHSCNHQYLGVSENRVPVEIRKAVYERIGNKKKLAELTT